MTAALRGWRRLRKCPGIDRNVSDVRPLAKWSKFGQFGHSYQSGQWALTVAIRGYIIDKAMDVL